MEFNIPDIMEDSPVEILGEAELLEIAKSEANFLADEEDVVMHSALAGHIMNQFQINKDARRNSGVEQDIINSLRQYNGNYSNADIAKIEASGGSSIFMNITATKCRTAASWIRDILINPITKSWGIFPTPMPDLPKSMSIKIDKAIEEEFEALAEDINSSEEDTAPVPQDTNSALSEPTINKQSKVEVAQQTLREINQTKRDVKQAIYEEIQKEAEYEMKVMERQIEDQFVSGKWDNSLSSFIDDFVVFPTAFVKGPIVTKRKRVSWSNGKPVESDVFVFMNKRVSPFDMYTAPEAETLQDGALCEHLRLSSSEVYSLIGTKNYRESALREVLSDSTFAQSSWMDVGIEDEKAREEMRGNSFEANRNVIHGIHFFGPVKASVLLQWGMDDSGIVGDDQDKEWEVEAILLNSTVVKCVLNDDPLLRRPYYSASIQNRPGSLWGRSLPNLMEDIQRMCNATVRALSNNMAIASGPQVEVYIDRLADNGEIEEMEPFKVWQLLSDVNGGGGRAINFFQPQSNASELLAVYEKFEAMADDATGIPKYAMENLNTAGAAGTASGLAMILDAASKSIKDAIRNIDTGVIVPRVEYQFYMNLIDNDDSTFTGDVEVRAFGSSALTVKGSEQMKRAEFLRITANPVDQELMGIEGRSNLLRTLSDDLGMVVDIIPNRLDMKKKLQDKKKEAAQAAEAEANAKQKESDNAIRGVTVQIEGQKAMSERTQSVRELAEQNKMIRHKQDLEAKYAEIESFKQQSTYKSMVNANTAELNDETKKELATREMAIKLQTGSGI